MGKQKVYKYALTIEFESKKPVKAVKLGDHPQFENGLVYFVETLDKNNSINSEFVYGSGTIELTKLGHRDSDE